MLPDITPTWLSPTLISSSSSEGGEAFSKVEEKRVDSPVNKIIMERSSDRLLGTRLSPRSRVRERSNECSCLSMNLMNEFKVQDHLGDDQQLRNDAISQNGILRVSVCPPLSQALRTAQVQACWRAIQTAHRKNEPKTPITSRANRREAVTPRTVSHLLSWRGPSSSHLKLFTRELKGRWMFLNGPSLPMSLVGTY